MSQVKKYKAEVLSIINPVENIYTVEFKSHSGSFKYLPGQFLHLALDEYDPSQGWPDSRCFSMQSQPSEENVKITFSIKGKFTSRMALELEVGKMIDLKLPFGDLFQKEYSKENVVFIAGGTGLTPFLSLFRDSSFKLYSNPKLYFGVRAKKFHIFRTELSEALRINNSLTIVIKNQEEEGVLNIHDIFKENGFISNYFISGPQMMISAFRQELIMKEVDSLRIITDDWD